MQIVRTSRNNRKMIRVFLVLFVLLDGHLIGSSQPRIKRLPLTRVHAARRQIERSASEPIVIKISSPGSRPTGRRVPNIANLPPEASIVRLKPVIRFHVPVNNDTVSDQPDLYRTLDKMGLHRMAGLLRETSLGQELARIGAVTIFAPTDGAFSLSPRGLLESIQFKGEGSKLREFLLYHVIRGHMYPRNVRNDFNMPTIHPSAVAQRFNVYNGGQVISVSGAQFLGSWQQVGDVLIQPIDRILFPVPQLDIVQKAHEDFHVFHTLALKSGLTDQLSSGTFTVFAPTNEAFSTLPPKAQELLSSNSTLLRKFVLNHVVPGTYFSSALTNGYRLKPLGGESMTFATQRGLILVNGIPIVKPDLPATNGVIHAINRVLVSEELVEQCRCVSKYPMAPATLKPIPHASPEAQTGETTAHLGKASQRHGPPGEHLIPKEPELQPRPLVQLLNQPIKLPDGSTLTFDTAGQLFRKSLLFNKLRQPARKGYTVLLPTDGAFRRLPAPLMERLQQDPRRLSQLLRWHTLEGNIDPTTLQNNARLKTLAGGTLLVNVLPRAKNRLHPTLLIGGIRILATKPAANGAVFAVDKVFEPPPLDTDVSQSLTETEKDQLSIWRQIIDDVPDLKAKLKSRQEVYTMFAPSNQAFAQLSQEQLQRLLRDDALKNDLIRSHVLSGAYFRSMLTTGMLVSTLLGNQLRFILTPDGFLVNDAAVNKAGVLTSNGVIYVIHKLLLNPDSHGIRFLPTNQETGNLDESEKVFDHSLEEFARQQNATTFLKWIHASGLAKAIRTQSHCTLFLPTNEAIATMSPTLRLATLDNLKALRKLVKYHICPFTVTSLDEMTHQDRMLPTLLPDKNIRCNNYMKRTVVTASGCPVSKVEILNNTKMSVAVLKRPLSPPVGDLFLTLSKSPMLRNLTKIIRVAEMDKELQNGGPFTLFAPSKCAFSRMPANEYEQLIANKDAAKAFVLRHLVRGCFYSKGISDGSILKAINGHVLSMNTTNSDCILVNGVKVKFGDLGATNGVIHVVADVL